MNSITSSFTVNPSPDATQQSLQQQQQQRHEAVVLFYRYLDPKASKACGLLHQHSEFYLDHIYRFQKDICTRLGLKGRILLAAEGINGTLSGASVEVLQEYRQAMETYDLIGAAGYPVDSDTENDTNHKIDGSNDDHNNNVQGDVNSHDSPYIFTGIDWKESFLHSAKQDGASKSERINEPFPNLKVSIVKELVSSGGAISVDDLEEYGGTHLTPEEFHEKIVGPQQQTSEDDANQSATPPKEVVLIDVRNTFEHAIGHFVNPNTHEPAMNPEMVTFSSFDSKFCEQHAPSLKDKTVLMYCTGGIRCEKASAMLKKRGVEDVYQLQGGIHRYLETYGESGCFRGRNFQFDQRVSLTPSEHYHQRRLLDDPPSPNTTISSDISSNDKDSQKNDNEDAKTQPHEVVGKCVECNAKFDELSGSRICTVCRDLVLVCSSCQVKLREYHCRRHSEWKSYYTFLEVFDKQQLEEQTESMESLLARHTEYSKHVRRTLRKQIEKLRKRLDEIERNPELVNPNAPRRCRSCREPQGIVCNGLCWGFWKTAGSSQPNPQQNGLGSTTNGEDSPSMKAEPILSICVGDTVRPGPHWNDIRYGNPIHPKTGNPLEGTVAEIKSWGTGSTELDCVAVEWNDPDHLPRRRQVQIYRWGAKAVNGTRLYDVAHCH